MPLGYPSPFWEIGLGAAEVEVDSETGEVKILRYVSLTDAGKMIHPIQCHAQDEGAAVFGIGQALFEDLVYQDGELVNGSLVDYRLPRLERAQAVRPPGSRRLSRTARRDRASPAPPQLRHARAARRDSQLD